MTLSAKREYLDAIFERYKNATKKQKSKILDEFCLVCGLTRKHAIRLLRCGSRSPNRKPGPAAIYDEAFMVHLVKLWELMHKMCGKRMKAALPIWLPYYEHADLTDEIRTKLLQISSSSIDRLLKPYRNRKPKGMTSTKPAKDFKKQIPIKTLDNAVSEPGHFEADTVAHCGNSIEGEFINTLTMVDLLSGWTENRACWNKKSEVIVDRVMDIRKTVPMSMKSCSVDNGSEFLNHNVRKYFNGRHPSTVRLTRTRPYKKNDAAHVEQRNDITVRKLIGYERLDNAVLVPLLNEIYKQYWNPLFNYFFPTMKMKSKMRIGGRIIKKYDAPKTPCQRLIDSGKLTEAQQRRLQSNLETLNPMELTRALELKLKEFHDLVKKSNNPIQILEVLDDAS